MATVHGVALNSVVNDSSHATMKKISGRIPHEVLQKPIFDAWLWPIPDATHVQFEKVCRMKKCIFLKNSSIKN